MSKKQVIMLVYNHFTNDSRVLKEATSLTNNGYDVTLYALWKDGLPMSEKINGFTVNRIHIKPIHKQILGEKGFSGLKRKLYKEKKQPAKATTKTNQAPTSKVSYDASRTKMSLFKFFVSTLNKLISYQNFYKRVFKHVKQNNNHIDNVHAHDMSTLHIGVKISRRFKAKLVYDSHELFVERDKPYVTPNWYKNFQKRFEKKRIRKANGVITVSQSIADELAQRYGIKTPTIILNAPIQRDKSQTISIKEKLGFTDEKVVMYSGGFTRGRGLEYLVASLKLLPSNYRLVFLGFGKDDFVSKLNRIASQEDVADRFFMYGPVPSQEVPAYLASADICVSPIQNVSLNNYYSFPNKVFEYIQAEVPMAVSNFPELKRLTDTEKIGTTFNPEKPENIAEAVVNFLENKELYEEAKNNLAICREKYHWGNEEKKLVELYRNLEKS